LTLTRVRAQAVASSGTSANAYTGVVQAFMKVRRAAMPRTRSPGASLTPRTLGLGCGQIYTEEGVRAFWKGNGTNVIRVAPYAAAQLSSNDFYKRLLSGALHALPHFARCFGLLLTCSHALLLQTNRRARPPVTAGTADVRRAGGHDRDGADAPAGARCS
jgi:hypothetical protein